MAGREDNRIFVGGLAWDTTETQLEEAFSRYGKILQSVVCLIRFPLSLATCSILLSVKPFDLLGIDFSF